ncbi:MBL fold metallo-hydrolase [Balneolaceae bacterium YR4-1]|uniref:MBL fold metallo-hydrolase n=1 Tax=Halalkalibaculum roseum TaxID=2709311 RepID=A0A6M1SZE5_9BACT|nr:MBL fold metallo-hydrolase [Halalkalibaculum roseum]NGP75957.1 MBL fold metallo-hydrolase [Halalkalibaculum roseum]
MELSSTKIGPFSLHTIECGRFRLDGGAMFGVVPKTLWARQIEADEKNRIPMAMRCLLITSENTGKVYLIDNGCGTKFDEKFESIYALDYDHSNLLDSLDYHGFKPEDITDLILSHLHFDHCGGTTYYDDEGEIQHTFPNATYHVPKEHWETANNPNAREKASFFDEYIRPMETSGRLNLVEEHHSYEDGFSAIPVNGHTISQQLPKIEAEGKTLVFAADLLPTHIHVPLPWVMGYDMRPVQTLDEKERILNDAVEDNWHFFLEHDAQKEVITVKKEDGKFKAGNSLTLSDL